MIRFPREKLNRWWGVVAAATAGQVYAGVSQAQTSKAAVKSVESAIAKQDEAANQLKAEQEVASQQATAAISERRKRILKGSQSIYSSPLGIAGQATTAKKVLLGQ